ncbi:MAG: DUF4080 domain-containing protein [Burkholderiales bacterium]
MADILLTTLNARYSHASLGLRYLHANLGARRDDAQIIEFVLGVKAEVAVERILATGPRVVGFGVYIWNVEETTRIVAILKTVAPHVKVVLGGPEVSYETEAQRICALADHVVTGWGEVTFAHLVNAILDGPRPLMKVHAGVQPPLDSLVMPYDLYDASDIAQRNLYVEASRGCPFKCEFCLSALDKTAWPFDLALFLGHMDALYRRGARVFRFVDRTFNLNPRTGRAILDFFLARIEAAPEDPCFVHFEVVPDHLPDVLKESIKRFPAGTLQFEIGIQTFDPEVQARISRRQDNERAAANIRWLREHSCAHLHVDLIAGLPGEDLASFARGFDTLCDLGPHEIQVGVLKRLRGTPIIRHSEAYAMRYNPDPPYNVLATGAIGFEDMQRIGRFARYWDLIANSGRFAATLPWLLDRQAGSRFARFMRLADWLYARDGQTHGIAMERLFRLVGEHLVDALGLPAGEVGASLKKDYMATGGKGSFEFAGTTVSATQAVTRLPRRQARHAAARGSGAAPRPA